MSKMYFQTVTDSVMFQHYCTSSRITMLLGNNRNTSPSINFDLVLIICYTDSQFRMRQYNQRVSGSH